MTTSTAPKRYRVIAPCVTAKTMALAGMHASHVRRPWTLVTLYAGGFMPVDAPPEQVANYLEHGYIEEVA